MSETPPYHLFELTIIKVHCHQVHEALQQQPNTNNRIKDKLRVSPSTLCHKVTIILQLSEATTCPFCLSPPAGISSKCTNHLNSPLPLQPNQLIECGMGRRRVRVRYTNNVERQNNVGLYDWSWSSLFEKHPITKRVSGTKEVGIYGESGFRRWIRGGLVKIGFVIKWARERCNNEPENGIHWRKSEQWGHILNEEIIALGEFRWHCSDYKGWWRLKNSPHQLNSTLPLGALDDAPSMYF